MLRKQRRACAHKDIGTAGNGQRTLRVRAEREARHPQRGGFLLNTATIGDHNPRVPNECHHRSVGLRRLYPDAVEPPYVSVPRAFQTLFRDRVQRKERERTVSVDHVEE